MAYAIFKMNINENETGAVEISYTTMMRYDDNSRPHIIQAEDIEKAGEKAGDFLRAVGVEIYTSSGEPDYIDSTNYFVGDFCHDDDERMQSIHDTYYIFKFYPVL
jgi:hypothetical protein